MKQPLRMWVLWPMRDEPRRALAATRAASTPRPSTAAAPSTGAGPPADYAAHRPGPPARLYDLLAALGVGRPGQRLLDLGTGTGLVAREFAAPRRRRQRHRRRRRARSPPPARARVRKGSRSTSSSPPPKRALRRRELRRRRRQPVLDVLRRRANARRSAPRPAAGRRAGDDALQLAAARRPDRPGQRSAGPRASTRPGKAATGPGRIAAEPAWAAGRASVAAMFWFDADVPFTRESWRGRMRACRGVGASLRRRRRRRLRRSAADAWLDAEHGADVHGAPPRRCPPVSRSWPPAAAPTAAERSQMERISAPAGRLNRLDTRRLPP